MIIMHLHFRRYPHYSNICIQMTFSSPIFSSDTCRHPSCCISSCCTSRCRTHYFMTFCTHGGEKFSSRLGMLATPAAIAISTSATLVTSTLTISNPSMQSSYQYKYRRVILGYINRAKKMGSKE